MTVTVVQTAAPGGATATSASATFASPVTAGNTICASVSVFDGGTSGFTVALTLGSSPDNWYSHRKSVRSGSGSNIYAAAWADASCAGGATTVNVTLSGATGGVQTGIIVEAYEVAGLPAAVEDITGATTGNSASWTTAAFTPSSSTSAADEFWWGCATFAAAPSVITGPSGWTNTAELTPGGAAGSAMISGWQAPGAAGTPLYAGTISGAGTQWAAAGATLKAGTVSGTAALAGTGTEAAAGTLQGTASASAAGTMTAAGISAAPDSAALGGAGTLRAAPSVRVAAAAALAGAGTVAARAGSSSPQVVNQWAGTVAQNPVFGPSLPGNAGVVVPLVPAASVGGGSGVPTAGSWLFVVPGWNQAPPGGVTVSVGDDTHMWWRPAVPSKATGASRVTCWYQPNILPPACVYVAPSGYADGMAVLVVEVAGLGPWDQVTAVTTAYAAAATSLALALAAPPGPAFFLAAACGDSTLAGTAVTHSGWTPLATVAASDGTDHTGDAVVAAACIASSSAPSLTATATAAEDLAGIIIGVLTAAASPVPAGINPNWPYPLFEAGFGSGFMTAPDQVTWTSLGNRALMWSENEGSQYELDGIQATEGSAYLDNPDAALSPFAPSSPYYPHVVPGTPLRMRAVPPASSGVNRWYVIQRNIETWPQAWDDIFRGFANTDLTDIWSVINRALPACYRAEVENDQPYAWWPADDAAGVPLPVSLVNAAPGNSTPLAISVSPAGLSVALTGHPFVSTAVEYSAVQDFAQDSNWMYGDPVSAAWQQAGAGDGQHGRYLSCNDAGFPPVSAGVTVEWWGNLPFLATGSGAGDSAVPGPYTQPAGTLILWQLASATAPVVTLQVSSGGALQIVIGTGAPATIYSATDLRNATWTGITVTLTTAGWQCWVNGGVAAAASGSASIPSAWTWFYALGGTTGTSPPAAGTITGICNAAVSHMAIYPSVLPAARVMAHFMAAYAAFGQLPAPSVTAQFTDGDPTIGAYAPDGNLYTGDAFASASSHGGGFPALAALAAAAGGAAASYPSVPESVTIIPATYDPSEAASGFFWLTAGGPAAPSYDWYTSAGAGAEELAAVTIANYLYVNAMGTGAAPPAAASALGDTVQRRIERLLQAGNVTTPARCIDAAASPVVAALDTGGQLCGTAITNIAQSDGGLLFTATDGNLCYWSKPHLAAQPVTWQLGPDAASGQIPYLPSVKLRTDPQQCKNDITITQASVQPDASGSSSAGSSSGSGEARGGLAFAPGGALFPQVKASQQQNGDCQYPAASYLQSGASIQAQANWLFSNFGVPVQRIDELAVEASALGGTASQAWVFFLSVNPGDLVAVTFRPAGQPSFSGTWRVSHVERNLSFGHDGEITALATIIADVYTPTLWS